tara:strand:+ start:154 stop:360 length:207 start_codon:yes stop_codon:yes gene_type:complete
MKEFVIWGIPPGKTEEEVLYTKAKSGKEAIVVANNLVIAYGVTKPRIQTIDLSECPSKLFKSKDIVNV